MSDVWLCIRCLRPLPHAADWDFWCDHCADTTAGIRIPAADLQHSGGPDDV